MPTTLDFITTPAETLQGTLQVPGDKSISHRAVILASIAEGVSQLSGFLPAQDTLATLQACEALGVHIEQPAANKVIVHGVGKQGMQTPPKPIDCGNSGTGLRLLTGFLAGQQLACVLTGDASLTQRPMGRIVAPLRAMGAEIAMSKANTPPLKITAGKPLNGIDYTMPMASAQVRSCLLLAGLYAQGETRITAPAICRDHTERLLQAFGYPLVIDASCVSLQGGGELTACDIEIPADISSAAFFIVAASIVPGSEITLTQVGINPTRDGVIQILRLMGADISLHNPRKLGREPVADVHIRSAKLHGITIPETLVPLAIDEFPAIFIAASCAQGATRLTGAKELKVKESDRIQTMADGLKQLCIKTEVLADGIIIEGGQIQAGTINSHSDHRISMAFAVAGQVATGPIEILDCANVATSFPNFIEAAQTLGLNVSLLP